MMSGLSGIIGALLGLVVSHVLGVEVTAALIVLSASCALGGILVAMTASILPLRSVDRLVPARVLAEE